MKNKKFILFLIVLFPSAFWLTLELSTINSKKLPFYGPKTAHGKDTVYYTVNQQGLSGPEVSDTVHFPLYVICFLKPGDERDSYKMSGLIEYLKYKEEAIRHVPIFWAAACADTTKGLACKPGIKKQLGISNPNVHEITYDAATSYNSLVKQNYFKDKPYYIDYSFLVLVDKHRHIRGYYDGRYVAEVKRLLEEYKHLRLKEEQKTILNTNTIESK